MAGLQQEREQLFQDLPNLKRKKDAILESISSGIKERDQIMQTIQNLEKESQQLNQALFKLKQEKDELSSHLKSLKETKDKEHLFHNLEEECAKLQKSAKLSCMVVKCQERNNILVQMTKILQKHGCIDYILKQQVEQLLTDPALQSYATSFTAGFTPEIMVTFEDSKRFTQDQPCSHHLSPSSPRGSALKTNEYQQLNVKAKSSPDLTRLTEASGFGSSSGSSSSLTCFGPSTRLSSPSKIMSLQEQLQKTLLSSFQVNCLLGLNYL
uniref:Uncharacterized protein n=1 Tax=Periophthalmus magnuspinnatus TaxID=409849 RepID=A0A3B3ZQZ2_9GOBI